MWICSMKINVQKLLYVSDFLKLKGYTEINLIPTFPIPVLTLDCSQRKGYRSNSMNFLTSPNCENCKNNWKELKNNREEFLINWNNTVGGILVKFCSFSSFQIQIIEQLVEVACMKTYFCKILVIHKKKTYRNYKFSLVKQQVFLYNKTKQKIFLNFYLIITYSAYFLLDIVKSVDKSSNMIDNVNQITRRNYSDKTYLKLINRSNAVNTISCLKKASQILGC